MADERPLVTIHKAKVMEIRAITYNDALDELVEVFDQLGADECVMKLKRTRSGWMLEVFPTNEERE